MGQSLSKMHIHLVFGTKGRYPFITREVENDLHVYIASILWNYESPAIQINSVPDHIHILFRLSKNFALAKVVEEVKKSSSKWIKSKGIEGFTWQIGYGAFSVSGSKLNVVSNYIKNQKQHHGITSFKEEFEVFVKENQVEEYDEKYFWA